MDAQQTKKAESKTEEKIDNSKIDNNAKELSEEKLDEVSGGFKYGNIIKILTHQS